MRFGFSNASYVSWMLQVRLLVYVHTLMYPTVNSICTSAICALYTHYGCCVSLKLWYTQDCLDHPTDCAWNTVSWPNHFGHESSFGSSRRTLWLSFYHTSQAILALYLFCSSFWWTGGYGHGSVVFSQITPGNRYRTIGVGFSSGLGFSGVRCLCILFKTTNWAHTLFFSHNFDWSG